MHITQSMPPTTPDALTRLSLDALLFDHNLLTGNHPNPACVSLRGACVHCRRTHLIGTVPIPALVTYLTTSTPLQLALPTLSPSDREFILTRTCPTCWSRLFPPSLSDDTDEFPSPSPLE